MKNKNIVYSGFARLFIGLFGIFLTTFFIMEISTQISQEEFRVPMLFIGFTCFVFVIQTIPDLLA